MTFILKNVRVKNFLGDTNLNIPFRPDVNFIIGPNGTGKTKFVRLLHSAITLDESELADFDFEEIDITFSDSGNKSPQLKVTKPSVEQRFLRFQFRSSGTEKFRTFTNRAEELEHDLATLRGEFELRGRRRSPMVTELERKFLSSV